FANSLYLLLQHPPSSPLFPYTTLFRSKKGGPRNGRTTSERSRRWHQQARPSSPWRGSRREHHPRRRRRIYDRRGRRALEHGGAGDRKSTRLNSSHVSISYAVFCLKKKK